MAEGMKAEANRAIDMRTLVMAVLFLVGGGAAGGGASAIGGNGVKDEVAELRKSVDAMRTDLAVIRNTTTSTEAVTSRHLADHEERLRALETTPKKR